MRVSDWSSDVCSSDLDGARAGQCKVRQNGLQAARTSGQAIGDEWRGHGQIRWAAVEAGLAVIGQPLGRSQCDAAAKAECPDSARTERDGIRCDVELAGTASECAHAPEPGQGGGDVQAPQACPRARTGVTARNSPL